jgi:hypothetical protein
VLLGTISAELNRKPERPFAAASLAIGWIQNIHAARCRFRTWVTAWVQNIGNTSGSVVKAVGFEHALAEQRTYGYTD